MFNDAGGIYHMPDPAAVSTSPTLAPFAGTEGDHVIIGNMLHGGVQLLGTAGSSWHRIHDDLARTKRGWSRY